MPRYENIHEYESDLNGKGLRIAVVMSRFNQDVCEGLLSACTAEL
ncbi:MAG: 6,7-dimethyl-8-ribityllumazine synthase, partial [Betaproteobacteria bacterium HGW-Betaproteobacteria-19]